MLKQQLTEVVTQSVVNDVETTTHTEEAATLSVVYDAETTTHRSCYTVCGQRC
jgi:hypothetical protein